MPLYGTAQGGGVLTTLIPGELLTLFSAESLTAPQASIAVNRGFGPGAGGFPITFQILYASSPTAVMQVLATNVSQFPGKSFVLSEWVVVYTSTNLQTDAYTDAGASQFYCAYLVSQSGGGAVTVTANA